MNNQASKQLVTIITEAILESEVTHCLDELGAPGYTVIDVRGKGTQGKRGGEWQESANIQIEVVCSHALSEAMILALQTRYFDNYGMIVYRSPVDVLRSEKF